MSTVKIAERMYLLIDLSFTHSFCRDSRTNACCPCIRDTLGIEKTVRCHNPLRLLPCCDQDTTTRGGCLSVANNPDTAWVPPFLPVEGLGVPMFILHQST